jgi:hypothetical protein
VVMFRSAELVELHSQDVDRAILVLRSAIATGADWQTLEDYVKVWAFAMEARRLYAAPSHLGGHHQWLSTMRALRDARDPGSTDEAILETRWMAWCGIQRPRINRRRERRRIMA